MTIKIGEDFKIICKFKRSSKKNTKATEEAVDKLIHMLARKGAGLFFEMLKEYKIEPKDIATGRITI